MAAQKIGFRYLFYTLSYWFGTVGEMISIFMCKTMYLSVVLMIFIQCDSKDFLNKLEVSNWNPNNSKINFLISIWYWKVAMKYIFEFIATLT